jgi:uncharacterized protein
MTWIKRNDIGLYLILAFALSWWPWPFHLANPNSTVMIPWGPMFAALIVLGLTKGLAGVKTLLADMFRLRVALAWYALAIFLPLGVTFAAVYLNSALGAPAPGLAVYKDLVLFIPQLVFTTLIAGPFTEEPGWRGFLLPRLQARLKPTTASLIIGLIWWIWHLPLMLTDINGQRPPLQFLAAALAYSVLFTYVYNHAKASVFLIILMHGVINTIASFLFRGMLDSAYYAQLWWLYAGLWWAAALSVMLILRNRPAELKINTKPAEMHEKHIPV